MITIYSPRASSMFSFFFNDTATTEIYTLSLHDALPIFGDDQQPPAWRAGALFVVRRVGAEVLVLRPHQTHIAAQDRKSTRLNSSHSQISYAVFCLKKKNYQHSTAYCTAWMTSRTLMWLR